MKGRDALREMLSSGPAASPADALPKRSSGAVRAMSLGLQQLSDEAATARSLREAIEAGEQVIEINPAEVDASIVADRIPSAADPDFAELKAAIAARGQQVPILVRPSPDRPGRYQVAYGRRRLRAALELGIHVKAVVRQLTDAELVIAQGQENGPRLDLSFIERALFAANLNGHKFDRDTITAALGVDKPELSRLLGVAAAVGSALILAIGPAAKVGRPRWLVFAEKIREPGAARKAERATQAEAFKAADSNARFGLVLAALTTPAEAGRSDVSGATGRGVAWIQRTRREVRLVSNEPAFGAFLERRLPDLLKDFEREADAGKQKGGV